MPVRRAPLARWAVRISGVVFVLVAGLAAPGGCRRPAPPPPAGGEPNAESPRPLNLVVSDPLCRAFQCECVEAIAGRRYEKLAAHLQRRLGRPVALTYAENVAEIVRLNPGRTDLVIGPRGAVLFDLSASGTPARPIALLSDRLGRTDSAGLIIVRTDDPARDLNDLAGRDVLLGPRWAPQAHRRALEVLAAAGVAPRPPIRSAPGGADAATDLAEGKAEAAAIAEYELPIVIRRLFDGNSPFRVIGRTEAEPFVTVFATPNVTAGQEADIVEALLAVGGDAELLSALQSQAGFVAAAAAAGWADWRGPGRRGLSPHVPQRLPARPRVLWRRATTGPAWSGLAVAGDRLIVADKDAPRRRDVWRCLRADTGEPIWELAYDAERDMDYTSSPRATPVLDDGRAYLLGALGDLHCVRLEDGNVLWRANLVTDFGAELLQWGACSTPLLLDGRLIVNPGAKDASLAALDARTGKVLWKTPGRPAAYASFIVATLGGRRQIVGYDCLALAGYDPDTGQRLWELVPPLEGDFNVPTPIEVDGKLLVASENNGTRLYGFDGNGVILPQPLAANQDLAPDTSTPVVIDGLVLGCWDGLRCLDLAGGLRPLWTADEEAYRDYAVLIAGNGRVLVTSADGELLLVKARREGYELVSRVRAFEGEAELLSHPALVGDRLYLRSATEVRCLLLRQE